MVKAGRKTLSCPRRQVQNQMEEDNEDLQPQDDTQAPSQPQPEGGAKSPGQPQPQAQASGEASPDEKQGETPMETDTQNQEAEDCPSRSRPPAARALWKPIPQIQPQPAGQWKPIPPLEPQNSPGEPATSASTRNQSCQTEEQPPQSSPGGHAHSLGYCIEPGDPPLFQQPLQTSKSGIQQIIECFRSGTCELKHMLLKEVDTIFECKLCRSLFRGLPNLITHKEYYCLRRMPETDGDDRQSAAIRDLLEAIYPRKDRPDHVVRLEPIETSNKAVFQYLSTEDELNRYPAHTASNRQSPVAWELEDGGSEPQQQQQSQQGPSEGPSSSFQSSQSYSQAQRRREGPDEEAPEEAMQAEEDGSTSGVEDVTISCCLCGKDFNSRRSIRRHCRKEHQTKLEELRKFTETRTVPTSLLSLVKGRPRTLTTPTGKSCPVCYKNFATKANVRRHFDEVHRGLRRDTITPEIATRPGQLLTLEATPPKKPANPSPTRCTTPKSTTPVSAKGTPPQGQNKGSSSSAPAAAAPTAPPYNLTSCRCLLCKRTYSSQVMLKRHMGIVHKMYNLKNGAVTATTSSSSPQPPNNGSGVSAEGVRVKQEVEESSDDENDDEEEEEDEGEDTESSSSASASPSDRADTPPRKGAGATSPAPAAAAPTKGPAKGVKVKTEEQPPPPSPKSSTASSSSSPPPPPPRGGAATTSASTKAPKLSVGFDFKQLFCKLCKRQFSSRQNLTKHIELHTDGTDIFIKFYRCPLCRYESRRKRDVLRHVTVVHKKSSSYLAKIMPNLESRAVKRSAESVLNNSSLAKKISTAVEAATSSSGGAKKEVNGRNASSSSGPPSPPSPPVTRKQDQQSSSSSSGATSSGAAPAATTSSSSSSSSSSTAPSSSKTFAPSPPVTRKQERQQRQRSCSPPLTRRSDKFSHLRQNDAAAAAHTRRSEAESGVSETHSSEVKVTKNFSLHACDQCGRAFAKKLYLESHKRSHRNAAAATENRRKGINTRSKSLLW